MLSWLLRTLENPSRPMSICLHKFNFSRSKTFPSTKKHGKVRWNYFLHAQCQRTFLVPFFCVKLICDVPLEKWWYLFIHLTLCGFWGFWREKPFFVRGAKNVSELSLIASDLTHMMTRELSQTLLSSHWMPTMNCYVGSLCVSISHHNRNSIPFDL